MKTLNGIALAALLLAGLEARAAIIWTGPDVTFSKAALANPALPANQDRLTDKVWITRGDTRGLYNAASESAYANNVSPAGTQWAYGSAADWATLAFTDWETWAAKPPETVGKAAVMHLVEEDIYLDVQFLSWGISTGGGGAFSYVRSSPVPEPSSLGVLALGALATLRRGRLNGGSRGGGTDQG